MYFRKQYLYYYYGRNLIINAMEEPMKGEKPTTEES